MKSLGSSDSLGALISICQSTEEKSSGVNDVYSRGFQSMLNNLDEEDYAAEESVHIAEKKRRLSLDQVKALEKIFEVENKLEPERKVKLAQELGLQPRQVAVWFQNRRARWKNKQLERDYSLLKANYESLKLNYDDLQHEKEALLAEIKELKSKVFQGETLDTNLSVKEEKILISENEKKVTQQSKISVAVMGEGEQICDYNNGVRNCVIRDFKDGSSDSDSSAILNEENSPNAAISSAIFKQHHLMISPSSSSLRFNCSSSSPPPINCLPFPDSRAISSNTQKSYQQFVKMEEHNFFSSEEPCNFFSDDQAPSLQWYSSDQWN